MNLPHNLDAEQAVLGSILLDQNTLLALPETVTADVFHEPVHAHLFTLMSEAIKAGKHCDPVALHGSCANHPGFKEIGGGGYLTQLLDCAAPSQIAVTYGELLVDAALRRNLIRLAQDTSTRAQYPTSGEDGQAMAWGLHEASRALAETGAVHSLRFAEDSLDEVFSTIRDIRSGKRRGVKTGLRRIDEVIGPMMPGDMIVIGARPSMGKSTAAQAIARGVAQQGHGVLFFSLEMDAASLWQRMISDCTEGARIPYSSLRSATDLSPYELDLAAATGAALKALPLIIDDRAAMTPSQMMASARTSRKAFEDRDTKLSLIIVDHITIAKADRDLKNRYAEMTEVSGAMKQMAKTLGVPVIALSQLNRQSEGRTDTRPQMSDLRETGAIEQDADVIILLHREAYALERNKPKPDAKDEEYDAWKSKMRFCEYQMQWLFRKVRHGAVDDVTVFADMALSRIRDQHINAVGGQVLPRVYEERF